MKSLSGEILPPVKARDAAHEVSFYPATFEGEAREFTIIPGLTVGQIVSLAIPDRAMWPGCKVWLVSDIGRTELSPDYWGQIRPRPGVKIEVSYMPMGDDGGKILRGILLIVIAVAAFYTGGLAAGALGLASDSLGFALVQGLVAAGIGALGMMAVNALVPIKAPVSEVQKTPTSSTGFSNRLAFGEPVPMVHGKLRVYPNMAAQNYFESVGDNRYQRALFLIGRGPCELSGFRIGNQPLDEFEDVEIEIMQGWDDDPVPTLYQREVTEVAFGTDLLTNAAQTFTTPIDTVEAGIDFLFPQGLITYDNKGKRQSRAVSVDIEWRKVGDVLWNNIPFVFEAAGFSGRVRFPFHGYGFGGYSGYNGYAADYGAPVGGTGGLSHSFTAKSDTPIIRNRKITFPAPGQYEIRLMRTTAAGDNQTRDKIQMAILRSFKDSPPVTISGLCLVAMRIRLTGQKSSQISNFNCVVQKLTPYHNGTAWVAPVVTRAAAGDMTPHRSRAPAAAYCDVFRGSGVRRVMADNRLDMASISEWWTHAASIDGRTGAARYTYDAVILGRTTVREMIKEICTVGRARFVAPNGQYGVMRDKVQTVPVNMFTARNSKNLSGSFNLGTPVHGIKIKFANEAKDAQEETAVIYGDGFTSATATEFEEITLRGMVNSARVHEFGRYLLAVMVQRPETITLTTYIDALHNQIGDYVVINHDVPRHGLSSGRILSLTTDINGDVTSITVDEAAVMAAGKSYAVSVRRPHNANMIVSGAINTVAGAQQLLSFTTPVVASMAPAVGDLVSFGEATKVTRDVIITGIRHLGKDYLFELTCLDLANGIHGVESEALPTFSTTFKPDPDVTAPAAVTDLVLTENVVYPSGRAKSEVWATWTAPVGIPVSGFDIYEEFAGEFTLMGRADDNRYRLPKDLVEGETITVRVVAVSLAENKMPARLGTSATLLLDGITDAIAALTGLSVAALPEALKVNWNASAALAAKGTHLYRATTDAQPAAPYKSFPLPVDEFRDEIGAAGQTYYYWVRPYDQDDVIGPWNGAAGVSGVSGSVDFADVVGATRPLNRLAATLQPGVAESGKWVRVLQVNYPFGAGRSSGVLKIAATGGQDNPGELEFAYSFNWGTQATIHFRGGAPGKLSKFRILQSGDNMYLDILLGTFIAGTRYELSVIPEKLVDGGIATTTIPLTLNPVTTGNTTLISPVNITGVVKGHHQNNTFTQTLTNGSKIVNGVMSTRTDGLAEDTFKVNGWASATVQSNAHVGWGLTQFNGTILDPSSFGTMDLADLDPYRKGIFDTALDSSGNLLTGLNSYIGTKELMQGIVGPNLSANPEFFNGSVGYAVYDNSGSGFVTMATVADDIAPNTSSTVLQISYDGLGLPTDPINPTPTPGFGGVVQGLFYAGNVNPISPGKYVQNTKILYKIIAKIPVGRSLIQASNPTGNGGGFLWLTPILGTGTWETYIGIRTIGSGGMLSSTGHIYILGGTNVAFDWFIAKYDQIVLNAGQAQFIGTSFRDSIGNPLTDTAVLNSNTTPSDIGYTGALNANYITNTTELIDGAGFSNTALWSNITGQTNAPASNADVTNYADDRVKNSGIQLNADGTMSYWNGASWISLGATLYGSMPGKPTEITDGRILAGLDSGGNYLRNLKSGVLIDQGNGTFRAPLIGFETSTANDGEAITFQTPYGVVPEIKFLPAGLTKQSGLINDTVIAYDAIDKTVTGFTTSLKLRELAGTPASHVDIGSVAQGGTINGIAVTHDFELQKVDTTPNNSWSNSYTFNFSVSVINAISYINPPDPTFYTPGSVKIGLYVKTTAGAAWIKYGEVTVAGTGGITSTTTVFNVSGSIFVSGVTDFNGAQFAVNVESSLPAGSTLLAFDSVSYSTATAPNEANAVPVGALPVPFMVIQ